MKVKLLVAAFMIAGITPVQANDQGAWVKVDASGNAVGQAIVCTPDVCGDSNSPFAVATLGSGERYVLQSKADSQGNVSGFGNNSSHIEAKVEVRTNNWTVISSNQKSYTKPQSNETITVTEKRVQTFNPVTNPVASVEIIKEVKKVDPITTENFDWVAWWNSWLLEFNFAEFWHFDFIDWWTL